MVTLPLMNKDTGMRIRVERELREEFLDICRAEDRPAAQVLREFMRNYVQKHRAALPDTTQDNRPAPVEKSARKGS